MLSLLFRDHNNAQHTFKMKFVILFILGLAIASAYGAGKAAGGPAKKKAAKKSSSVLEEVTPNVLNDVLEDNDEVLVLFYEDTKTPATKKMVTTLEKFDMSDFPDVQFVRCSDPEEAEAFGIKAKNLPKIVMFENGIPDEFDGDILDTKALTTWVKEEMDSTDMDVLDIPTMEKIVKGGSPFVIIFVDDHKRELNSERAIMKVTDKYDIGVAKVEGLSTKYGIDVLPTFVYFEDGVPSVYDDEGMIKIHIFVKYLLFFRITTNFANFPFNKLQQVIPILSKFIQFVEKAA